MQKQMDEVQAAAATATTDAAGLFSGLLNGQMQISIELPPKESMAPAMPEESLRTKIVKTAIAAVQSGEFIPTHLYYKPAGVTMLQPCGCAIAALYYGGVKLGLAPNEASVRGKINASMQLRGFQREELYDLEEQYERIYPNRDIHDWDKPFPEHAGHMIQCLGGLLEKE